MASDTRPVTKIELHRFNVTPHVECAVTLYYGPGEGITFVNSPLWFARDVIEAHPLADHVSIANSPIGVIDYLIR